MVKIAEYKFSFSERNFDSRLLIAEMQSLCITYNRQFADDRDRFFRTVTFETSAGSTLLASHQLPDNVPRLFMTFLNDGLGCFPTGSSRAVLPLTMLLILGGRDKVRLSVTFLGDEPDPAICRMAAKVALQEVPGLSCPDWFPEFCFEAAALQVQVPESMDFRA